jgi:serine/threonine protein kinase
VSLNEKQNAGRDSLSLEALERIDAACERFEQNLRNNIWPRIEDYLADFEEEESSHLLPELLHLEITYRNLTSDGLTFEEYRIRFPNCLKAVESVIEHFQLDSLKETAPQPEWHRRSVVRRRELEMQLPAEYEVLDEIARGGQGVVYRARQVNLDRIVAVKVLHQSGRTTQDEIERFEREARVTAQLKHPNIVAVYDVGHYAGQPFIVMEYVDGSNLSELVGDSPLPPKRAAYYVHIAARAIEVAHEQGVMHRDLKPSNILIDKGNHLRVTDFGLAKMIEAGPRLTETGIILGTVGYISPEQAVGDSASVGPPSDVYSLGAILYELLTTRPPFAAPTFLETLRLVQTTPPIPPRELDPAIPPNLEAICLKCL